MKANPTTHRPYGNRPRLHGHLFGDRLDEVADAA
jgi:hypothetical protein